MTERVFFYTLEWEEMEKKTGKKTKSKIANIQSMENAYKFKTIFCSKVEGLHISWRIFTSNGHLVSRGES